MGFLTIDHTKAQQGRFVAPEGIYECMINSAGLNTTMGGTEFLGIKLSIRGDVAQDYAGERIDWPVWRRKNPSASDPDGFPLGTIQHISRVTGLPNGQDYATFEDWTKAITGKPIRVEIRHEEYNGREQARVAYVYETEHKDISIAGKGFVPVDDDEDFPF